MPPANGISASVHDSGEEITIDIPQKMNPAPNKNEKETIGYKLFNGWNKRKKEQHQSLQENEEHPDGTFGSNAGNQIERSPAKRRMFIATVNAENSEEQNPQPLTPAPPARSNAEIIDITQNMSIMLDGPGLRYVGHAQMPPSIRILISEGEMFTIGRFDASVGRKQSCFEFDKRTKAVSRRHAVIERDIEGYKIVDLSSSAGTFVNDKKLPPNTPHGLETGCRISFGNSGADYVWEAG